MKNSFINDSRLWLLALGLLFPLQCVAAQFVELTAEIALDDWNYRFFCDRISQYPGQDQPPSIFNTNYTVRCVVGTNTWLIEGPAKNEKTTFWFTGTNIIEHTLITAETPQATTKRLSEISRLASTSPHVGEKYTRIYESVDGNPGRPVRVVDLMGLGERVSWLAFCSGSFLKRDGRQIFPLGDFWKESLLAFSGWSDQTAVFKDDFGLPKSLTLLATTNQPVFRYQTRGSTNVLGWNFPLEFYCVQYWPRTNSWEVQWTAKGRVTAIGVGTKPEIPAEVLKAIQK